jgi:hypothetical protein
MGCAGMFGFVGESNKVHNVHPNAANPNCHGKQCSCAVHVDLPKCQASVHNVHHQLFQHGDYFVGKNHAWKSWLPTLWGYDPVLYRQFIEACQRCHLLETQQSLLSDRNDAISYLKQQCWGWTNGTLEQFVERELKAELAYTQRILSSSRVIALTDIIISTLWSSVSNAAAESDVSENRSHQVLQHLNPRISLKRCIAATLECT